MVFLKSNFNFFYPNELNFSNFNNNCLNRYFNITNNFQIIFCFFSMTMTLNENGGIIHLNNIENKILIESCTFYECKVDNNNGGAIFCNLIQTGSIVLNKVCANKCYTGYYEKYGQFGSIKASNIIIIRLTSICFCSPFNSNGRSSLILYKGLMNINSYNSSFNKVRSDSGIFIIPNNNNCYLNFSTLSNNIGAGSACLYCQGENSLSNISFINCIKNIRTDLSTWGGVVINFYSNLYIYNFIFFNNENILFYGESGSIFVRNCFVSHSSSLLTSKNVNYNYNYGLTNSYKMTHFSSYLCYADITPLNNFSNQKKNFKFFFLFNLYFIII